MLGFLTALSSNAGAVVARDPTQCSAWAALPETKPFLEEVPSEGYVFLPFELMPGTNPVDHSETVALDVQLRDADGTSWPGYMAFAGYAIPGYDGTPLLWTSSRPFTPGGRYELSVSVQNPADCPVAGEPIQATYDVRVSDETLGARVHEANLAATPTLEWIRGDVSPQCCVARSTEHCADPEHCFACMKSAVWENVVISRTPSAASAYLAYDAAVRGADGEVVATYPFDASDAEARLSVPLCLSEYCTELHVTSPLTQETVTGDPTCIQGSEPQIDPAPDGAELVMGNPCAEGTGTGNFQLADAPDCKWYPDVRWFSSEVDGLVALGLSRSDAEDQARVHGTGAFGGAGGSVGGTAETGGTGGTVRSTSTDGSCAVTVPRSDRRDVSALAVLFGLVLARRRARR